LSALQYLRKKKWFCYGIILSTLGMRKTLPWATENVTALYGQTIVIPCNDRIPPPEDTMFIKWKYEKKDNSPGDLLIKQAHSDSPTIQATDEYKQRVSIDKDYSLLITGASLNDQRTFTCMVVSESNLLEYPVSVLVHKAPSVVEIQDQFQFLQKDKPVTLGTCSATNAHPPATLTWTKNGKPLEADGKTVIITSSIRVDPATGLSTSFSTLQYTATKEDAGAVFACGSRHALDNQERKLGPSTVHYPPEKVSLEILSKGPIIEGENVTLKCHSDGNPVPTSFFFHIKDQKVRVENSSTYTVNAISRDAAGEYKCSLVADEKMEASQNVVVSYLDLSLSPTGKVVKNVGDSLNVTMEKAASGNVTVSWTKDGKAVTKPTFSKLTFADSGVYACKVSMSSLTRQESFELLVEGKPVITSLTKRRADEGKYKVLRCEAEGAPEPSFQWSVNGTDEKSSYSNGRVAHTITVTPRVNLTVTCIVSNKLGDDSKTINVSSSRFPTVERPNEESDKGSQDDSEDQSKVIVGVVVGLLIAAALVGLLYWLYMKNSRQGSWKTGEKDTGTSEEIKKLEENSHSV
uniref:Activated leukocyte cell adhesion molecule a n=1 Tax=Tetraodon nigroviridis TaxID=99883 RepID=H3BXC9_TETNG